MLIVQVRIVDVIIPVVDTLGGNTMIENKNLKINLDSYGRVVIEDPELLAAISGATEIADAMLSGDVACGNNSSCDNTSC